jgi:hypothetical protein
MIGKSMFMAKQAGSVSSEEITRLVEQAKKLPSCRGYESDYERVIRDEQTDDFEGVPYIVTDEGFK